MGHFHIFIQSYEINSLSANLLKPKNKRTFAVMKTSIIIRFALLFVAWAFTVWVLVASTPRFTPYMAFVIIASAIIVFVPVYKKYIKNGKN